MQSDKPVVLFDGVCNLCNGTVRFLVLRDPQANLKFASLQSEFGQDILSKSNWPVDSLDTFILVENGKIYGHSTAALRLAAFLRFPWPIMQTLLAIPRPLRDVVYNWVARNRYRWFGRLDHCPLPTPELQSRFIS